MDNDGYAVVSVVDLASAKVVERWTMAGRGQLMDMVWSDKLTVLEGLGGACANLARAIKLPENINSVVLDPRIHRRNSRTLFHGLRNDDPVKWIAVVVRQRERCDGVIAPNRKNRGLQVFHGLAQPHSWLRDNQFPNANFDAYLPQTGSAQ